MVGVLIVPTGIGCSIGGHAGDANPVCKLLAACCDTLITHPNVVNASDINEMPDNVLYVEGSILDRFLENRVNLKPVSRINKILVLCNEYSQLTENAVSAARHTIGVDAETVVLRVPLVMNAGIVDGKATGTFENLTALLAQIHGLSYDALAIHTPIGVSNELAEAYYKGGTVNPWGGVEAVVSRAIAEAVNRPVAHAPLETTTHDEELFFVYQQRIDPRKTPEAISMSHLHCVLKGLHKAPKVILRANDNPHPFGLSVDDVDWLVSPIGCWGAPHNACVLQDIPIITVEENHPVVVIEYNKDDTTVWVENYWEAVGWIMCNRAGVKPSSVRL